jgi:hypothetical protein
MRGLNQNHDMTRSVASLADNVEANAAYRSTRRLGLVTVDRL